MPIHLPPISRRQFLAGSVAAGAGLALGPDLFAETRSTDPNLWALLSDTHLAADRATLGANTNMADHFITTAKEIRALPRRPAGLFITGDCAHNTGQIGDYATLTQLIEPIRSDMVPIHLALGNHDHRERFWEALKQEKAAKRPLQDRQVALLQTELANWFILDSLEQTLSVPGLIGASQLNWLAGALDSHPEKPALVLVHHNPGNTGTVSGLKDTDAFLEVIRPRKQVKAYVFGHTHVWKVEKDSSGIHFINLPSVAYVFQPGLPTGWVRADLQPGGVKLELRCQDTAHKAHGEVHDLKWRV